MYSIFKRLLVERGLKTSDISKATGISQSTFSEWKSGKHIPNVQKMKLIADFFNVSIDYLMSGTSDAEIPHYYSDPDVREMAEFLHKNPRYKVLFDAAKDVSVEDIDFVKRMIDAARSAHDGGEYEE